MNHIRKTNIIILNAMTLMFICTLIMVFAANASDFVLTGAGATFPQPYYNKMFDVYQKQYGIKIRYQGTGSSDGISQLVNKSVDFAGTDVMLNEEEKRHVGFPVIQVPTCIGAVALIYNVPGNPSLKLTSEIIAQIYLGKIKRWNDPDIVSINKGAVLPDTNITVVHRSDGSGTTYIFSEYLSKTNSEWKERMGTGKSLIWPVGKGARGNPGVAGLVRQISGSIGYVELTYAIGNAMTVASVKNKAGRFIYPTTHTVSRAASLSVLGDSFSITDTHVKDGYPISGFTWIVSFADQYVMGIPLKKAEEMAKLLWWIIHDGQKYAEGLHYTPLPKTVIGFAEKTIKSMTYKETRLLQE